MVIKSFRYAGCQGNIVIGILIFLIIVLVQFIVITKGAGRVSGGRPLHAGRHARKADGHRRGFELRHLLTRRKPGYGVIRSEGGRLLRRHGRRKQIVKGDAVVSLIITVINFVAGLIIGIVQGGGDLATVLTSIPSPPSATVWCPSSRP